MAKKGMTVNMPGVNVNDALAAAAAGVAEKTNVNVNENVKQEESVASTLRKQAEKEVKSIPINLRIKPSVRELFEQMRKQLRYSQSDFFEVMVKLTKETIDNRKEQ
jgi:hypothetical protein